MKRSATILAASALWPASTILAAAKTGALGQLEARFGDQNCLGSPACLSTPLAVCRDKILWSTGKVVQLRGECQISWSPLPWRTNTQPASFSSRITSGVKL